MLVAPQSIEASLIARRLQRWGGQTCMVSDLAVAQALLPERTWHAVLLDDALGSSEVAALGEAARGHATHRIVPVHAGDPAGTAILRPLRSFTGYLIKPLRAASLAARLTMTPEVLAPDLAGDGLIDMPDNVAAPRDRAGARAFDPGGGRQRDQRAVDAFAADALGASRRHHHQWRGSAGNPGWRPNPPARPTTSC